MHQCMGYDFVAHTAPAILKVIFGLKNLRRAESPAGEMASFMRNTHGTDHKMYIDNVGNVGPWPGSLTVVVRNYLIPSKRNIVTDGLRFDSTILELEHG